MWSAISRSRSRGSTARALRRAVQDLPLDTRRAMLAAIETDEVIAGAYVDRGGRVCPMLAAHRRGAGADGSDFARAWDGFVRARRRARPAPEREVQILRALLQESVSGPGRAAAGPRSASPGAPETSVGSVK